LPWWAVVAHTFSPSTWEAKAGGFLSSRPAWSTELSSRRARAIQRNPVFEKQTNKQTNRKENKNKKRKNKTKTKTKEKKRKTKQTKSCLGHGVSSQKRNPKTLHSLKVFRLKV
jgi:collagenase-like PrtC family protease